MSSGRPRYSVDVVGDLDEPGGHRLSLPDHEFDTAEVDEFGEASVGGADEENPATGSVALQ